MFDFMLEKEKCIRGEKKRANYWRICKVLLTLSFRYTGCGGPVLGVKRHRRGLQRRF